MWWQNQVLYLVPTTTGPLLKCSFSAGNESNVDEMCTCNDCFFHRRECDQVASDLRRAGIHAQSYHAGLSDDERVVIQERWINEDGCKVRTLAGYSNLYCKYSQTWELRTVKGLLQVALFSRQSNWSEKFHCLWVGKSWGAKAWIFLVNALINTFVLQKQSVKNHTVECVYRNVKHVCIPGPGLAVTVAGSIWQLSH